MNIKPVLAITVLVVFFAAVISAIGLFLMQMGVFD